MYAFAHVALAAGLLSIAAWVVGARRARPDLFPRWFALKVAVLLSSIAAAALAAAADHVLTTAAVAVSAGASLAITARLWWSRRWLLQSLSPMVAAQEARRLTDAALEEVAVAEREREKQRHADP